MSEDQAKYIADKLWKDAYKDYLSKQGYGTVGEDLVFKAGWEAACKHITLEALAGLKKAIEDSK